MNREPVDNYIDQLVSDLTCDDVMRCQKARRVLVKIGSPAIPTLVKALGSKKQWVRWEAAKALSQIGDPTATSALIKALEDREFDVQWVAAEGLIAIGDNALAPLLRRLIECADSIQFRLGTHHVLRDMFKGNLDTVLEPVITALEGPHPTIETPIAAKRALDALREEQRL